MEHYFSGSRTEKWIFGLLCLYALSCDISLSVANFAIDIAMLLFIFQSAVSKTISLPDSRLMKLFGLHMIALVLAGLFAYHPAMTVEPVWRSFYYMVPPFLLAWRFVNTERKAFLLLNLMFLSGVCSSLYVFFEAYQGAGRPAGLLGFWETPYHIVQFVPYVMALIYFKVGYTRETSRLAVVGLLLMLFALLLTQARQSWLAQLLILAVFAGLVRVPWKRCLTAVLLTIIVVGIVMTVSPNVDQRIRQFADRRDQSKIDRISMWKSAAQIFSDHPVTGIGPGNSPAVDPGYMDDQRMDRRIPMAHPHNTFLQLLVETGIIGFSSYLLLYGFVLVAFLRQYRKTKNPWALGAFLSIGGIQFCGLTENFLFGLLAVKQSGWFITGMVWRMKEAKSIDL